MRSEMGILLSCNPRFKYHPLISLSQQERAARKAFLFRTFHGAQIATMVHKLTLKF